MKTAFLYQPLKNKSVLCTACYHRCQISEGKTGICGVIQNISGKLELLVFGKAIAVNIDPIEKKPFYHFLPASKTFSIGTFGCNFRCLNCQNYDLSQILGYKGNTRYYSKIAWGKTLSPKQAVQAAQENGCESIAYTYNEPTIWTEYALLIMKRAKKEKLFNLWVSNGFMTKETRETILPYLDAINIDIKSFSDQFYRENCGAFLAPVLENCRNFKKKGVHLEITTLVIPTLSDNETMLKKLSQFIKRELGADIPWHVTAFSGKISWKLQHLPETPAKVLEKIRQIGLNSGLKYVYAGNILTPGLENTYCPKCSATVIERMGYNVENHLKKGFCPNCGYQILFR